MKKPRTARAEIERLRTELEESVRLHFAAHQRMERAEAELAKCGRENCMGYKDEGVAHWVREERLKQVEAELAEAKHMTAIMASAADGEREGRKQAEAERDALLRERSIDEQRVADLMADLDRVAKERDALRSIILWALGENGEFPARPEDWEQRKHKPWYWWRTEMRNKFDAALRGKEQSNG